MGYGPGSCTFLGAFFEVVCLLLTVPYRKYRNKQTSLKDKKLIRNRSTEDIKIV
jgi:hypothetical protein